MNTTARMRDPLFTDTMQISIVVRDLDATLTTYVEEYGIGPREIYEFNPDTVSDMVPEETAYRIAVTMIGSVQWELVQPLDDRSVYAEFLRTKGEGVHHVAVAGAGYREQLEALRAKGRRARRAHAGARRAISLAAASRLARLWPLASTST
jgi:methylmalonyl-CoA/ethylmalonyl-CoA epimerase